MSHFYIELMRRFKRGQLVRMTETKAMFCVDCAEVIGSEPALSEHFKAHPGRRLRVLRRRKDGVAEITFKSAPRPPKRA
jgi:hypothetical protein